LETTVNSSRKRAFFALSAATTLAISSSAHAEESPYCEKVRARAASEAALLFAPSVHAQGVKFPTNGLIDTGATTGNGFQFRAAVSWSPLDFYKGFRVRAVGDAECRAFEAAFVVQSILRRGADGGRLRALEKQSTFLESRRDAWSALAAKGEERFDAHAISLVEVNEVRARAAELARQRAVVRSEIELLQLRDTDHGSRSSERSVEELVTQLEARAMELEREASHVRSLASWQVTMTGGVIPHTAPVDYFGMVNVGFNFGAFARNANETRYLDARQAELAKSTYEAREQVRRLREEVRVAAVRAGRELEIVDAKLSVLASARSKLTGSDSAHAPHATTLVELDMMLVESEQIYLSELRSELRRFEEKTSAR
jgi:hypothetical protein